MSDGGLERRRARSAIKAGTRTGNGGGDASSDEDVRASSVGNKSKRNGKSSSSAAARAAFGSRPPKGNDEQGGFFSKISWLHLFFLALFTLPTAFAVVDYFFNLSPPPGQAYGTLTEEGRMYRTKIKAFYSEYNPEKLKNVDALMAKYKGRERALYNTIRKKYRNAKRFDQRYDE